MNRIGEVAVKEDRLHCLANLKQADDAITRLSLGKQMFEWRESV